MLYIVPTPIGNLKDITLRALEVLKNVDLIIAEDTRHTKRLLTHFGIAKPLQSYHAHNEHQIASDYIDKLKQNMDIALVSDGGTPGISDPGYLLINICIQQGIPIDVLPGASAVTTAVVASGLPSNRFYFEGFLPHKKGRQSRLSYIAKLDQSIVLFESPHRLKKCLHQLQQHCGPDRQATVCKELSKIYQTFVRGTLQELTKHFESVKNIRGEYVIVISGQNKKSKPNKSMD